MKKKTLKEARLTAQRFIYAVKNLEAAIAGHEKHGFSGGYWTSNPLDGSKESGAVRRVSMDLTRALADLRQGR